MNSKADKSLVEKKSASLKCNISKTNPLQQITPANKQRTFLTYRNLKKTIYEAEFKKSLS